MDDPASAFQEGLMELFENDELFDVTFISGDDKFRSHRVVISAHSEYFRAACKQLKNSGEDVITLGPITQPNTSHRCRKRSRCGANLSSKKKFKKEEAETDTEKEVIDLSEQASTNEQQALDEIGGNAACRDPESIRLMMYYFYNFTYEAVDEDAAATHAKDFAAATHYKVPGLQALAAKEFKSSLNRYQQPERVASAIRIAFTTTFEDVRELRDLSIKFLLDHDNLLDNPSIEAVVRDVSGLACELAYELLKVKRRRTVPRTTFGNNVNGPRY